MAQTKLLSLAQAAKRLGVSPQAVHMAIDRGTLAATKPYENSLWFVSEAEVARYRAEHWASAAHDESREGGNTWPSPDGRRVLTTW